MFRRVIQRHPLLAFAVPVVALTWAVQLTFLALGLPLFPALLIELVTLVVWATTVTRVVSGREGVHDLFAGIRRWRIGVAWYVVALAATPVLTLGIAAVTGTLDAPRSEWAGAGIEYLFVAVVFGALLGNIWEELAWTGFLQQRLTQRHGQLRAALITAVPFGLIHLPLAFEADGLAGTSARDVALAWVLLIGVAPFFRYLIGLVYSQTGRSLVGVALVHGSFNASGASSLVEGGWEYIPAVVVLALVVAAVVLGRLSVRTRYTTAPSR